MDFPVSIDGTRWMPIRAKQFLEKLSRLDSNTDMEKLWEIEISVVVNKDYEKELSCTGVSERRAVNIDTPLAHPRLDYVNAEWRVSLLRIHLAPGRKLLPLLHRANVICALTLKTATNIAAVINIWNSYLTRNSCSHSLPGNSENCMRKVTVDRGSMRTSLFTIYVLWIPNFVAR